MFFVFDGADGTGKTTQLNRLADWLSEQGHEVVTCKDPGTTELGERLREILLSKSDTPIHMRSEMMLFTTARTQLVEQIVRPALQAGKVVVLDRYVLSTVVYQGHAGPLDPTAIRRVNDFATDGLWPIRTFVLDLPTEIAMQRLGDSLDRMESRGMAYFEKVRAGFLAEAEGQPDISVIDATRTADQIAEAIRTIAQSVIEQQTATGNEAAAGGAN
ncbi:dTMP kinase [Mariniblastus fucicola]|uniref:Thymidylate kinase n=1 Tax=Mariniblastus fucicola TaxID=980251 RepID=A0A5B9P479_9BACT|nr:dTMP kinase [Mariniblastus fucicola]QEG21208.1 Thymidylate kinase [Mariniblastus fucicola]